MHKMSGEDNNMDYKLTKLDDGSKCPKCLFIGRNFLIINETLSACCDCGCVFISKGKRVEIRRGIADLQSELAAVKPEEKVEIPVTVPVIDRLKCDKCDYVGRTEHGLRIHRGARH